ncbi:ABC transporter substrate-binding protein [Pseudoduganella sp. UC29_106]|uniref:ABC transporter substrate-binding protein n=1 Tax=Pseudoduganella sp. UC29_106 TaxID=3374553 RepID=UPI003757856C
MDATGTLRSAPPAVGVTGRWPVVYFHNMAITLKVRLPRIGVEDLSHYRVNAFRGASKAMGGAYQEATADNPAYREMPNMPSALLMLGQLDVVVSQPDIFRYYLTRQAQFARSDDSEVAYHDILGKGVDYWFQFRTAEQRDLFERGLAALYRSGAVDRIFDRYRREYGTSREFFRPLDCQFLVVKPRGCPGDAGKAS